jgi:hypothetical protein
LGVLTSTAVVQAVVEYGLSSSTGGLRGVAQRIGDLGSSVGTELGRLAGFALANPALTLLLAALVAVAAVVRGSSVR